MALFKASIMMLLHCSVHIIPTFMCICFFDLGSVELIEQKDS